MTKLAPKAYYFKENGWNWKMRKSKKATQKVFRYGCVELLCPTVKVFHE